MDQEAEIRDKLNSIPVSSLESIAKSGRIKGYTKKRKSELVEKILPRWDFVKDDFEREYKAVKKAREEASAQRTNKGTVTKLMKQWGKNLQEGDEVDLIFHIDHGHHMGCNGEPWSSTAEIKARGVIKGFDDGGNINVTTTQVGSVAMLRKPEYTPKVGATYSLGFHPRSDLGCKNFTMPRYSRVACSYALNMVTPFDEDPVYKEDSKRIVQ